MGLKIKITIITLPILLVGLLNGLYLPSLSKAPLHVFFLTDFVTKVLIPLICIATALRVSPGVHIGLRWLPENYDANQMWIDTIVSTVVFSIIVFVMLPFFWFFLWRFEPDIQAIYSYASVVQGTHWRPLWLLYFSISAALFEEIYYRGILRVVLPNQHVYLFVSSSLFAFAHWEGGVTKMATMFLFGLAACSIYLRTKNLWPIIFGHLAVGLMSY